MQTLHALIIDDNEKNVNVLARLMAEQGMTSTIVTRPQQLPQVLAALEQVHIAFVDLEMPGLDGYTVLGMLRADPRFNGVPIIACTVHVSEINFAHQHGFDGFIGKPLDPDRFPQQLARVLEGKPVWEAV
jgi:two-component system cell cycle response regulator DivK